MTENWPFDQGPNVEAVTTRQVIEDHQPILSVHHDLHDHLWSFFCGTTKKTSDYRLIAMGEALEMDPTLEEIADLNPGWSAWREEVGRQWNRYRDEDS